MSLRFFYVGLDVWVYVSIIYYVVYYSAVEFIHMKGSCPPGLDLHVAVAEAADRTSRCARNVMNGIAALNQSALVHHPTSMERRRRNGPLRVATLMTAAALRLASCPPCTDGDKEYRRRHLGRAGINHTSAADTSKSVAVDFLRTSINIVCYRHQTTFQFDVQY